MWHMHVRVSGSARSLRLNFLAAVFHIDWRVNVNEMDQFGTSCLMITSFL